MNTTKTAIVLAGLMVLCGGCAVVESLMQHEKPTAKLMNVSFGEVSTEGAELLLDVDIKNPYALDLPLLDVDYDVQSEGQTLLAGKADISTTIPAKSNKAVTLPVRINFSDLLKAITSLKDVRPGSEIPYVAQVGVSIDSPVVGVMRVPLSKEGTLTLPTVEDMAGQDWKKLLQDSKVFDILK